MNSYRGSIFDAIKDKPTLWMVFAELMQLSESVFTSRELTRISLAIYIEIARHCKWYKFILEDEVFQIATGRKNLFLNDAEVAHIYDMNGDVPSKDQRVFVVIFLRITINGFSREIMHDMLKAIDNHAYYDRTHRDQLRANLLPHIKLAIAYAEAE